MLQIKEVRKTYKTGDFVQTALNGISLNLRDNEFVAILGPSGSGKTTLLNIIGGLDRYDSGDLVINGISTRKYSDRDWDSYRNHTIGFVFQSYNLIPHQSVLANVELALTISGISRSERKKKAEEALMKVGLGDHMHKKPNQLSGGQMQRVAIARALVNDPDILLADEPTGALDTSTSIQVMDLLKEVANERLVVMVTHNPELAQQYATRIVQLRDGEIRGDSMPFLPDQEEEAVHRNMGHSSMSFLTSLLLSFNNLRTKKGRTFLTAFAGSIGIIGIALILSLSNGVHEYIKKVEEETLSEYPLEIDDAGMNLASLMVNVNADKKEDYEVKERQTLSAMFSRVSANDLYALRNYFEGGKSGIYEYANAIDYTFSLTPQIYRITGEDTYRQVNPNPAFSSMGMTSRGMSAMMNMNSFSTLPKDAFLYEDQYEVKAGKWPENEHECVVVLSSQGIVTDLTLYTIGLKDPKEFDDMMEAYRKGEEIRIEDSENTYLYNDFLGRKFKVVDSYQYYEYDSEYDVYVDRSGNQKYMMKLVRDGQDLEIVGVVQPKADARSTMLSPGINYHQSLNQTVMRHAADSEIVKRQLSNKDINVFTGKDFSSEEERAFDMASLFTVDAEAMKNAFQVNTDAMNIDPSAFGKMDIDTSKLTFDMSAFQVDMSDMGSLDLSSLLKDVSVEVSEEELLKLFQNVLNAYLEEAAKDPSTDYARLPDAAAQYFLSGNAYAVLEKDIGEILSALNIQLPDSAQLRSILEDVMSGFPEYAAAHTEEGEESDIAALLQGYFETDEVRNKLEQYGAQFSEIIDGITVSDEQIQKVMNDLYEDYVVYAKENELPDPTKLLSSFTAFLGSEKGSQILNEGLSKAINMDDLQKQLTKSFSSVMTNYASGMEKQIQKMMNELIRQISKGMMSFMSNMMGQLMQNMQNIFSVDVDAFSNAIQVNMDADQLQELLSSMMTKEIATYDGNLLKLNYAEEDHPNAIFIYPKDFEGKEEIIRILDAYNSEMEEKGMDDKVITYTDYIGALMSSVTNIIDTISYVLVAFVAISLIVSSIMIGIITYISVLERTKEIGILRAIGASKRNISQVFNAETFIIGLLAGVLGILIASLLLIPGNAIIHAVTGNTEVSAILPPAGAVILIVISVLLTLIGGIIPSKKAAKKDPVTALRTE